MAHAVCALFAPCFLVFCGEALAQDVGQDVDGSTPEMEAVLGDSLSDAALRSDQAQSKAEIGLEPLVSDQSAAPIGQDGQFEIGPIVIRDARVLTAADFLDIIEAYSARRLSQQDLASLTEQIAARARDLGYVFATAWIDPQSLETGVLRVSLDEGTISEIRNIGDDDPAIHAQLAPLVDGEPVTLAKLERQILLADDVAGIWIRNTQFVREGRRGVLLVDARRSRYQASIELDNGGTPTIGPYRARITADVNGLITDRDRLNLTYSTTPLQPDELQYGRVRYEVVLNSAGTRLNVAGTYSEARPGAYLAEADILGDSWTIALGLRHPLVRSRSASLWLEGSAELRQLQQETLGFTYRKDRVPVLRAGFYGNAALAGGRLRGRLTFSRGLNILDATGPDDPYASRRDASAKFSKLHGWANWAGPLSGNFSLSLSAQGQIASAPLLISEDLGLGGRSFLRGYSYNQNTGDQGVMGSAELRYDWQDALGLVRKMQIYAFADGGTVSNLDDGFGSGSLASGGGGLRTEITRNLDIDLELALPLTDDRYDTGNLEPQLNFWVRRSF